MAALTSLDLVDQCDVFPYADTDAERYAAYMRKVYVVVWADTSDETPYPIGYMLRPVLDALAAIPKAELSAFGLDPAVDLVAAATANGIVPLYRLLRTDETDEAARTRAIGALMAYWRARDTFRVLRSWRDEAWPVYGRRLREDAHAVDADLRCELLFCVERAATGLLGVVRYGVHLTAYQGEDTETSMRIWVARRAHNKSTYPGMLDNAVAGGLMAGETPWACTLREAEEEASLPPEVTAAHAVRVHGCTTYIFETDVRAGGKDPLPYIYPECEYLVDLRLPDDGSVVPRPNDDEVAAFELCSVAEVRAQLARGEYKPNCALVMLEFLVRHGLLTAANYGGAPEEFDAFVRRMHRPLPFPGPHLLDTA